MSSEGGGLVIKPLELTEEQTAKLSAVLRTGKAALSFDKIGSKEINETELSILLKLFGMEDLTEGLMTKLDTDQSHSLSFDELLEAVHANQTGNVISFDESTIDVVQIREAFDTCDSEGRGVINRTDLSKVFRRLGKQPTDEALDKLMSILDLDKDGLVSWMEFLYAMVDGTVSKLGINISNLQQLATQQVHFMYTVHDPSNEYPEQVCVAIHPSHVEVMDAESQEMLDVWTWSTVSRFIAERQSDDPTDMELFTVEIDEMGQYVFECDDAHHLKTVFQDAMLQGLQLEASGKEAGRKTAVDGALNHFQLACVRAAFWVCEADVDDTISLAEAELVLKCLGYTPPKLQHVLARMDQTGTGEISFIDFQHILEYEQRQLPKDLQTGNGFLENIRIDFVGLRRAYDSIDVTCSKQIDFTLLRGLMQRIGALAGVSFSPQLLAQIWFTVDAEGYGVVEWVEFLRVVLDGDLWPHDPRIIKAFLLKDVQSLEMSIRDLEAELQALDNPPDRPHNPSRKSVKWRDESGEQSKSGAGSPESPCGNGERRSTLSDISIFNQLDSVHDMFQMQRAEEEKQRLVAQLPEGVELADDATVHTTMKKARNSADVLINWCIRVPVHGIGTVLEIQKQRKGKSTNFRVKFEAYEKWMILDRKEPNVGKRMYEGGSLKWYKYPFELLYHADAGVPKYL